MKKVITLLLIVIVFSIQLHAQVMMLPGFHEYKYKDDPTTQTIYTSNGKVHVSYAALARDNPYDKGSAEGLKADIDVAFNGTEYAHSGTIYYQIKPDYSNGKYFYHVLNSETETELIVSSKYNDADFKKVCDMVVKKYNH